MSEISNLTACVVDTSGYFIALARRLCPDQQNGFGRVLFHNPNWQKSSPVLNEAVIGDGFPNLEWCEDFWPIKQEIDCFIFPDLQRAGMQQELRDQGFPVWGAGRSMKLETNRIFFLKTLEKLELDVPEYEAITGLDDLAEFLSDKTDYYIKMSKWRGSWETYHWRSQKEDGHRLHYWHVKYGPLGRKLTFLCFPKIDTNLEIGADAFNIRGQWPQTMLHGIECKDRAYFGAVTKRDKMPKELTEIMEAFSPVMSELQGITQWSMEVRVTNNAAYFLDGTLRGGLPSTASQLYSMTNLPLVFYAGAQGELLEPEYEHPFVAECMVKTHGLPHSWETIVFDEELADHLKCFDCCMVDDQTWFPPDEAPIDELAWLVAGGQTPTEVASEMNRLADLLPDGADAAVESLADAIREIEEMESKGMPFADKPMPKPEIVLASS